MGSPRFFLFGRFSARDGQEELPGLDTPKVQELLCYLLLCRDRPHSRETLAGLLWGDRPTAQSRTYLRKALWQLQAALNGRTVPTGEDVLLVEPGWVQANPRADLWVDAAVFEAAFQSIHRLPGRQLDLRQVEAVCEAVSLYRGDLLEGWYQDWVLYERERLQHIYLSMLDKLMDFCEAHGKYDSGLIYGQCILRYDRARERTHRRLMRLYYLSGDRTAALRQYKRCVAALAQELGVGPAQVTVALYERIRADRVDQPLRDSPDSGSAPEKTTPAMTPAQLERLLASLSSLQQQMEQAISAIEQTLGSK